MKEVKKLQDSRMRRTVTFLPLITVGKTSKVKTFENLRKVRKMLTTPVFQSEDD